MPTRCDLEAKKQTTGVVSVDLPEEEDIGGEEKRHLEEKGWASVQQGTPSTVPSTWDLSSRCLVFSAVWWGREGRDDEDPVLLRLQERGAGAGGWLQ